MALLTSVISPYDSSSSIASSTSRIRLLHGSWLRNVGYHRVSVTCSSKFPGFEQFYDPDKLRVHFNHAKDRIVELVPDSVKQFPWKKVESVALQGGGKLYEHVPDPIKQFPWKKVESVALQGGGKLYEHVPDPIKQFPWKKAEGVALQEALVLGKEVLVLGKEVLKWGLIVYFALSFVSDFIYTISRNKELVMPFGLFVGCLMANYFDEISQEVIRGSKIDNVQRLLGIACLFVLVKFVSVYFSGGRYFLLHAANGGLMQLLWKWSKLPKEDVDGYLMEDAINPKNTGD